MISQPLIQDSLTAMRKETSDPQATPGRLIVPNNISHQWFDNSRRHNWSPCLLLLGVPCFLPSYTNAMHISNLCTYIMFGADMLETMVNGHTLHIGWQPPTATNHPQHQQAATTKKQQKNTTNNYHNERRTKNNNHHQQSADNIS